MPKILDAARKDAEARALADYQAVVGKIVEIRMISGYNAQDDSVDVDGIPIRVRVDETPQDDLRHWCDDFLDPYWNVTVIGEYPELAGLRSLWTFGPSYQVAGEAVLTAETSDLKLEPAPASVS